MFTFIYLYISTKLSTLNRIVLIITFSLLIAVMEQVSEKARFFIHGDAWQHYYSFIGYSFYMVIVWWFFNRVKGRQ